MSEATKPGEFELIERYFAPLAASSAGALGLTDDAAVLELAAGKHLVMTMDTMVAGVHFLDGEPAEDTAAKLLRVNLSDLAAMGAVPLGYTLSTALPAGVEEGWIAGFSRGLAADQERYGIVLLGGDMVATPGPTTLTVAALGTVAKGAALRRSAAEPGDAVYVSGTIGDGALGLMAERDALGGLAREHAHALIQRYHRPEPRLALGQRLVGLAHGVIDISDGLIADLGHVCATSGVAATIDADRVPLSAAARAALAADERLLARVLTGGDDYELLFTAPPQAGAALERISAEAGVAVTVIGIVAAGAGTVRINGADGRPLRFQETGYRHF